MRPIPKPLKAVLEADPFMKKCCIPHCTVKPDWEHCWKYAGRQIGGDHGVEDWWAIVPMCYPHHQGSMQMFELNGKMVRSKQYGQWVSLNRGLEIAVINYPKFNWRQEKRNLDNIFL